MMDFRQKRRKTKDNTKLWELTSADQEERNAGDEPDQLYLPRKGTQRISMHGAFIFVRTIHPEMDIDLKGNCGSSLRDFRAISITTTTAIKTAL